MSDGQSPLEGEFIAANAETRALTGDVRVTRSGLEFASGVTLETEYVDAQHATTGEPRVGSLPLYQNPAGHCAEMRNVTRERAADGKKVLTGGKGMVTLQYDEPPSSLQITSISKGLFGGTKVGPLLVYLSRGYYEIWAAEQAAKAKRE
jgi:hypothetical protein